MEMEMIMSREAPEKKKHTPTPWKPKKHEQGVFTAANGRVVLQVLSNGPLAEVVANIEFVDRAVNHHDALIKAIESEAARRAYAAGLGVSEWEAFLWPEAIAALAAAKE